MGQVRRFMRKRAGEPKRRDKCGGSRRRGEQRDGQRSRSSTPAGFAPDNVRHVLSHASILARVFLLCFDAEARRESSAEPSRSRAAVHMPTAPLQPYEEGQRTDGGYSQSDPHRIVEQSLGSTVVLSKLLADLWVGQKCQNQWRSSAADNVKLTPTMATSWFRNYPANVLELHS